MARILKQDAERFLADVPEENVFRCCDGSTLRNMKELGHAFNNIGEESFIYHANAEKNDFSNWVKDVIRDEKLARDLTKSRSQSQAAKAVADRMSFLSNKL
jgi:hypothetical protein